MASHIVHSLHSKTTLFMQFNIGFANRIIISAYFTFKVSLIILTHSSESLWVLVNWTVFPLRFPTFWNGFALNIVCQRFKPGRYTRKLCRDPWMENEYNEDAFLPPLRTSETTYLRLNHYDSSRKQVQMVVYSANLVDNGWMPVNSWSVHYFDHSQACNRLKVIYFVILKYQINMKTHQYQRKSARPRINCAARTPFRW